MQPLVKDIREQLAGIGVEFKATDVQEILQAAANLAKLMGGYVLVDPGAGWALEVELNPSQPGVAHAEVFEYEFGEDEELMN